VVASKPLPLSFDGHDLSVRFAAVSGVFLDKIGAEITLWKGASQHTWRVLLQPENGVWQSRSATHGLAVVLREHGRDDGALELTLRVKNISPHGVRISRIAPLVVDASGECCVGADAASWSVYRQGYQSWTGTRSFRAGETDRDPWPHLIAVSLIDVHNPSPQKVGELRSDMFTAVKNLCSGECLVAGFLDSRAAFGGIEVSIAESRCTRFAATLDYDGVTLDPGAEIECAPLWLAAADDEHALMEAYMEAVAKQMQARVPDRNPVGWCSWYYYFTDIDEPRMVENLENLATIGRQRDRLQFDYFQIDDGYQAEIGDWTTTNAKFPRGMSWMSEQIRKAGYDAGIWTAPFIAKPESRLMREHPDWFVRNDNGKPTFALWNPLWGVRSSCYALDTTHPQVLQWLRDTFRTIARDWGYQILKLDFLYAAALPGRRYDPNATRAVALRRGLEAIREGAGDEAFLLGCGCPQGPAIGVVDAMRIGPDVAPWWTNLFSRTLQRNLHGLATLHAIRNTLTRAYSHRRWWLNDPDCLMVRDTKTKLSDDEVRSLATAIAVTDGMIVLSDRIEQLSAPRLALLERTLSLAGGKVRVDDLMRADVPEIVVSRSVEQTIVAIFNFADQPQAKRIDLHALAVACESPSTVQDVWTDTPITIRDGQADCGTIPAHGCRVLRFAGTKGPS